MTPFKKAEKRAVKLRAAIDGPTGSGKTITALKIARGLVGPDGRIAVIDTEHGTAEKFYARVTDFDTAILTQYQPQDYVRMIEAAHGYDCLIIDSLSHAWTEGVLSMVDARSSQGFNAWKDVTPHHNALVKALLTYPGHLIVTMRSKMAYEVSKEEGKKTTVAKLGLRPVQREGMEYEFDLVMDMDVTHRLVVSKSRMSELADRFFLLPDEKVGEEIGRLISDGVPDPQERARELLRTVGRDKQSALVDGLADAGIASADLADDGKWEVAQKIAALIVAGADPDGKEETT